MSNAAIQVEGLAKQYRLGVEPYWSRTLRGTVAKTTASAAQRLRAWTRRADTAAAEPNTIWALKDVSFEVQRGEVLGVIGRNGAGKSTLLKILSRITEPTQGFAELRGRVGSLLEVGTGFHPDLTGRENIYLNGAILGMRRTEIARKFDEIVAFSEVEKFIDTPVKRYSSGMYLRLAFAVAAHLEPDILFVDEVLAVGDASFQRKCLGKMQEVGNEGRTVLFVSHNMTAIAQLAPRTVLLQNGTVGYLGESGEAIRRYLTQKQAGADDLATRTDRAGDGIVRVVALKLYDRLGASVSSVFAGGAVTFAVRLQSSQTKQVTLDAIHLEIRLTDILGQPVTTFSTRFGGLTATGAAGGVVELYCTVPSLTLAEDSYYVDLYLGYRGGRADYVTRAGELDVLPSNYFGTGHEPVRKTHGPALLAHSWDLEPVRLADCAD